MQDLGYTLLQQVAAYTLLEAIGVILAVMYLLLAIRQNIWCWFCAGISSAIFAFLFFLAGWTGFFIKPPKHPFNLT